MTNHEISFSSAARRALTETLPEAVAAAAYEFITGPLAEDPRRVGAQLRPPLFPRYRARRGEYRIIYEIGTGSVHVISVVHRRDAYR